MSRPDRPPLSMATVRTSEDVGRLMRSHRRAKGLSLERVAGLSNVGVRFLSEVERGKPTAEMGKVLRVLLTLGIDVHVRSRELAPHDDREPDRDGA